MSHNFNLHALNLAEREFATTAKLTAKAFNISPDEARAGLNEQASRGYLRTCRIPGLGDQTVYTPSGKGYFQEKEPLLFRSNAPDACRYRALLRHALVLQNPGKSFAIPAVTIMALRVRGIQLNGIPQPMLNDGRHVYTFGVSPNSLASTISRFLAILENGFFLHFVVPENEKATLQAAIAEQYPAQGALVELNALLAEIKADKTGLLAVKYGPHIRTLQEEAKDAIPGISHVEGVQL